MKLSAIFSQQVIKNAWKIIDWYKPSAVLALCQINIGVVFITRLGRASLQDLIILNSYTGQEDYQKCAWRFIPKIGAKNKLRLVQSFW